MEDKKDEQFFLDLLCFFMREFKLLDIDYYLLCGSV